MKPWHLILVIMVSVVTTLITARYVVPQGIAVSSAHEESAYERVLRTNTLRCGYDVTSPYFIKDPKTGALSGIWYDFTEAVADHLGIKVIWTQEIGRGDISAALGSNKIDAYCSGLWSAGKRVRVIDYLHATAYEPLLPYVRSQDHRFDHNLNAINDPSVRVSTMDGEGGGLVASEDFPKAKLVSLPQLANYADMFNQVVTNKADILFAAPSGVAPFLKNNPGTLRPLADKPLRIFPVSQAVLYGEGELRDMLNQAQDDVINNGTMDKIISKYEVNKGDFWRITKPYAPPQ